MAAFSWLQAADNLTQEAVFVAGQGGYHSYRIPAVIASAKGTLLAFCEGRKEGRGDSGNIDLVLRRSSDGGQTWGALQLVADDGPNTIGNPCPVVERRSGVIWLPVTHNLGSDKEDAIKAGTGQGTRTVWVCKSTDDGLTWSKPVEITSTVKPKEWSWYATGPGNAIQLSSGRLLVPCDHRVLGSDVLRSHVIYSDDLGENWKLGGVLDDKTNECAVVELSDGSLLLNMRSYHGKKCRAIATSHDGGLTWSEVKLDPALPDPVCQGSLIRYSTRAAQGMNRLLFSNPASTKREKLTVRLSLDEGRTWPMGRELTPGPAAYSSLVVLPKTNTDQTDQWIGCLYERGEKSAYETITFARFSLKWLTRDE